MGPRKYPPSGTTLRSIYPTVAVFTPWNPVYAVVLHHVLDQVFSLQSGIPNEISAHLLKSLPRFFRTFSIQGSCPPFFNVFNVLCNFHGELQGLEAALWAFDIENPNPLPIFLLCQIPNRLSSRSFVDHFQVFSKSSM